MARTYWILLFFILAFSLNSFADNKPFKKETSKKSSSQKKKKEPKRRAKPTPFDSIFPVSEYPGPSPLMGVPNDDTTYPLTKLLWKACPVLKKNDIRVYGWIEPSANWSTSKNTNFPLSNAIVPNAFELDQAVLVAEKVPNTVQTDHMDWGFRFTNLYGIDYRFTIAQGLLSDQLLKHNNLYGYDPVEFNAQWYIPNVAEGLLFTFGRYIAPAGIESIYPIDNYLFTHSITATFEPATQTGVTAALKLNDTWTIQLGIQTREDVAAWDKAAYSPTLLAMVRWVSADNNDSVWGGINSVNEGNFKANHDNIQDFDVVWTHRFNKTFFTQSEIYYFYQFDAPVGGTCIFGPVRSFGGGGGCGPIIPGFSPGLGAINYLNLKVSDKDFVSFRSDFLEDFRGQETSFATAYMSYTLGLTHEFSEYFYFRPEIYYGFALNEKAFDNGARKNQLVIAADVIYRF